MNYGSNQSRHAPSIDEVLLPSGNLSLTAPAIGDQGRPPVVKCLSAPAYQSPVRHHRRLGSPARQVKETLNAHTEYSNSEDDGAAIHRINQYTINQEIGRGSFGAVHRAVDQYGNEYAVKEFSKSRLRKRAQSHLLRKPKPSSPMGQVAQCARRSLPGPKQDDQISPLDLIKEEIAIMKKLHHNNLVSLIEVLDDPQEDSLYMVLEICKKGVVMKVGLDDQADPYDDESCRCWFRDMILGIEYLHAQGILHRDIKPDNCLITDDDILKIVDFGVSEMFEKHSDMNTVKSAGSPAFIPPELCVAKHGPVSGKAADIWSMGVTLYCLRHGTIPFERPNVVALYEAIRQDDVQLNDDCNDDFRDLMRRILEKDPAKRIPMEELRVHPWVTKGSTDPMIPAEENTADIIEPPTEAELDNAITGNLSQLLVVMKAVKRFKNLLVSKRPELMEGIFGRHSRIVKQPLTIRSSSSNHHKTRSVDVYDRRRIETALVTEGVHRDIAVNDDLNRLPERINSAVLSTHDIEPHGRAPSLTDGELLQRTETPSHRPQQDPRTRTQQHQHHRTDSSGRGQAHDPLTDTLFFNIGAGESSKAPKTDTDGALDGRSDEVPVVSESPSAVEMDIFEAAYQEEMQKITRARGQRATIYLTRRVEGNKAIREHENVIGHVGDMAKDAKGKAASMGTGLSRLVGKAMEQAQAKVAAQAGGGGSEETT